MLNVPVGVLAVALGGTAVALVLVALLTGWYDRARGCRGDLPRRARQLAPFLLVLVAVLTFNAVVRPVFDELSGAFALNLTDQIYAVEGSFVSSLQAATPEPLVVYFAATYVVGYATLLVFPLLAYAVLDDLRLAKTTLVAYATNYFLGALVYSVVDVYGPRNIQAASGQLYELYPTVQYLTAAVNSNSNAFPSLHTSLSVTVLALAYYSRREYPGWFVVAGVLAPSVVLATMVLGIHWLTDVVAGVVLAAISVHLARWVVPRLQGRGERQRSRTPEDVRL